MNTIAKRLKEFRLKENLNQESLARIAGITQAAWAGWEKHPPKALQSLVDLAHHYRVSVDYLLGLTDDPTPKHEKLDDVDNLIRAIYKLPARRRRDLLTIANAYLAQQEGSKDPADLLEEILGLIEEYSGTVTRDEVIDLMRAHVASTLRALPEFESADDE